MIVRLTRRQHGRVCEIMLAEMDERFIEATVEWLTEDVVDSSKHRVDVAMPAIAWKRVWDVMFDHCYDNRGMRSKGVRSTDLNALKQIRLALNVRETHPALSGISAIGMIAEVIPAWRPLDGQADSPYPVPNGRFLVLAPQHHQMSKQRITTWVPSNKHPEREILTEAEHRRFLA